MQVDYFAVSFVRNASDIRKTRKILNEVNATAGIIAKIERSEAIETVEEIIQASDGVMIARGDLGVEFGDAEVPAIQKQIIERARFLDKPVITAAQMMESMIQSPVPTRSTPLWMSRIRTAIPIFGLSRHSSCLGKITLYRNVYPLFFDVTILKHCPEVLKACVIDPIATSQSWSWHGYRNYFVEIDGRRIQSVTGSTHWGGGLFVPCS